MCGIAGWVDFTGREVDREVLAAMGSILGPRGPDDEGYLLGCPQTGVWQVAGGPDTPVAILESPDPYLPKQRLSSIATIGSSLGLVSRRLAIIDLSPRGHQPLCNEDASVWIVYNGEIYNAERLREELLSLGHRFRGRSDTEVVVHAHEQWGTDAPKRFNGMWAYTIWDVRERKLVCCRDRFGIKPFYFHLSDTGFAFSSEIKALLEVPGVPRAPNLQTLWDYLVLHTVDPLEDTFFEGVQRLGAGEIMEVALNGSSNTRNRFWSLERSRETAVPCDPACFRSMLVDAVRCRLVSDVPVGTCLSGGLDSSTIVCLIDSILRREAIEGMAGGVQKTFSARFQDSSLDEGQYISAIVNDRPVEAYFTHPGGRELVDVLDALVFAQDEPFGSTSIFAQWSVFRLAKECGVTVTLDGQGADEQLAGYHSYYGSLFGALARQARFLTLVREVKEYVAQHRGQHRFRHAIGFMLPKRLQSKVKVHLPGRLRGVDVGFFEGQGIGLHGEATSAMEAGLDSFHQALKHSLVVSGLPTLLRYEDRNSMAHSVESRVPFLDHRLVETVYNMPIEAKIRRGQTKAVLREALVDELPDAVRLRTDKIGFATPERQWFRTDLLSFANQLFASSSFVRRPFFRVSEVREALGQQASGKADLSGTIWRWICVELWLRQFID